MVTIYCYAALVMEVKFILKQDANSYLGKVSRQYQFGCITYFIRLLGVLGLVNEAKRTI